MVANITLPLLKKSVNVALVIIKQLFPPVQISRIPLSPTIPSSDYFWTNYGKFVI